VAGVQRLLGFAPVTQTVRRLSLNIIKENEMTLIEEAKKIMNAAITALIEKNDTAMLEDAAKAWEEAGSPKDAEVCRLLAKDSE
jgi:hypothetical protein